MLTASVLFYSVDYWRQLFYCFIPQLITLLSCSYAHLTAEPWSQRLALSARWCPAELLVYATIVNSIAHSMACFLAFDGFKQRCPNANTAHAPLLLSHSWLKLRGLFAVQAAFYWAWPLWVCTPPYGGVWSAGVALALAAGSLLASLPSVYTYTHFSELAGWFAACNVVYAGLALLFTVWMCAFGVAVPVAAVVAAGAAL